MYVLREPSSSSHGCKTWVHTTVLCGTYTVGSHGHGFAGGLILSTDSGQEREHILLGRKNVKTILVWCTEKGCLKTAVPVAPLTRMTRSPEQISQSIMLSVLPAWGRFLMVREPKYSRLSNSWEQVSLKSLPISVQVHSRNRRMLFIQNLWCPQIT